MKKSRNMRWSGHIIIIINKKKKKKRNIHPLTSHAVVATFEIFTAATNIREVLEYDTVSTDISEELASSIFRV
jgi:hypothetical protein